MENKKEPLMSQQQYDLLFDNGKYYIYHTKWHLNNAKEFVADGAKTTYKKEPFIGGVWDIDKQSIHTAIDNYIEINLKKEL